jgi:outer membrane protein OmpA-like peptidoglycan-associated protein
MREFVSGRPAGIVLGLGFALAMSGCAAPRPAPPPAQGAATASPGELVRAVADERIVVPFGAGGTALNPDGRAEIDRASRLFRTADPSRMTVAGHTDSSGSEFSNLVLSARRAETVKAAMVARGIPEDRLVVQALGESDPTDDTKPDDPANRRVVITWRLP